MGDLSREPSMEEILSSIRRVISRDEPVRARSQEFSDHPLEDEGEEDILELIAPGVPADDDEERAPAEEAELVSADSVAASRHSLDALAAILASRSDGNGEGTPQGATTTPADVSVHALVEAALRPMLAQWLDTNLPAMVERLVAKEIERIVGGAA